MYAAPQTRRMRSPKPHASLPMFALLCCAVALPACVAGRSAGVAVPSEPILPAQDPAAMTAPSTTLPPPSELTAQSLTERLIAFITALRGIEDLGAESLRRTTGLPIQSDPGRPNDYGIHGRLTDVWYYALRAMSPDAADRPNRVLFELNDQSDSGADMSPVCVPIERYRQALTAAGFGARKLRNRLDTQDYWEFSRDRVGVTVYLRGRRDPSDAQTCVSMAIVEVRV